MNMQVVTRTTTVLLLGAALFFGQAPPAATPEEPASPVAPQPTPKSQEEVDAIMAIQAAVTEQARLEAVDKFASAFPDSEFLGPMLQVAALTAQQMNDYERLLVYGERTLKADPNAYTVMIIMANALAQRTREFDLDKDEKLERATDYATRAQKILDTAPRPNPQVTDAQWEGAKQDLRSQAHAALALVAMARKDYDTAIAEFRTSIDVGVFPDPTVNLRLANALSEAGRYDQAVTELDTLLSDSQLDAQIRKIAEQERLNAVEARDAAKK